MKKLVLLLAFGLVACVNPPEVSVPYTKQSYTSKSKLKTIFKTATPESINKFYESLQYGHNFGLVSKMNEDMYLATILTEVGTDLVGVRENLNYSCSSLKTMFSYYSKNGGYNDDGRCNNHDANQPAIGNKAYSNRLGNGGVSTGDGYRFRGGGYAQTTGRYNYQVIVDGVNKLIGSSYTVDNFADNIHKPYIANLGGMGYWYQVDAGSCDTMDCVTDKWNKYTKSREERNSNYVWISGL